MVQRVGREPESPRAVRSEDGKFQTWEIPSGGGVVRNMMATQEGNLVLACSGVDRIALVDLQ